MVVSHPMDAVKEQSANLYALKIAEHGFVTLALDLHNMAVDQTRTASPQAELDGRAYN